MIANGGIKRLFCKVPFFQSLCPIIIERLTASYYAGDDYVMTATFVRSNTEWSLQFSQY